MYHHTGAAHCNFLLLSALPMLLYVKWALNDSPCLVHAKLFSWLFPLYHSCGHETLLKFYESTSSTREARCGEQAEPCKRREHLFIGGKGSTRLWCAYSPNTRWPCGDCFARRSLFFERKTSEHARGRSDTVPRDDHTETNVATYEAKCVVAPVRCL